MTSEPRVWTPSVDYLVKLVPDAFRSLLPSLSAAGIRWHERESYDPWDHIAQVIYEEIVIVPLRYATKDFEMKVPQYDMRYRDLADMSFVRVVVPSRDELFAFHSFVADDDRFEQVRSYRVDANGNVSEEAVVNRVDDVSFAFEHRQPDGSLVTIRDFVLEE